MWLLGQRGWSRTSPWCPQSHVWGLASSTHRRHREGTVERLLCTACICPSAASSGADQTFINKQKLLTKTKPHTQTPKSQQGVVWPLWLGTQGQPPSKSVNI